MYLKVSVLFIVLKLDNYVNTRTRTESLVCQFSQVLVLGTHVLVLVLVLARCVFVTSLL